VGNNYFYGPAPRTICPNASAPALRNNCFSLGLCRSREQAPVLVPGLLWRLTYGAPACSGRGTCYPGAPVCHRQRSSAAAVRTALLRWDRPAPRHRPHGPPSPPLAPLPSRRPHRRPHPRPRPAASCGRRQRCGQPASTGRAPTLVFGTDEILSRLQQRSCASQYWKPEVQREPSPRPGSADWAHLPGRPGEWFDWVHPGKSGAAYQHGVPILQRGTNSQAPFLRASRTSGPWSTCTCLETGSQGRYRPHLTPVLGRLEVLLLHNNYLTGVFPQITNTFPFTSAYTTIDNNYFYGPAPSEICKIQPMAGNCFSGAEVPCDVSNRSPERVLCLLWAQYHQPRVLRAGYLHSRCCGGRLLVCQLVWVHSGLFLQHCIASCFLSPRGAYGTRSLVERAQAWVPALLMLRGEACQLSWVHSCLFLLHHAFFF